MDTIIGIIAFIFVLGVIIAVHEGGHYIFAKRAGILVREFAFGMGPQLVKKKKGETVYSIRAFPIGGFCAIAGEEVENDPFKDIRFIRLDVRNGVIKAFHLDEVNESLRLPTYEIVNYDLFDADQTGELFMRVWKDSQEYIYPVDKQALIYTKRLEFQIAPYNRTIGSKPIRSRALVMFGGSLMNFILALVVFFIAALIQGFPNYESSQVVIYEPTENTIPTAAYSSGLRTDDIITNLKSGSIEQNVQVWDDISMFMNNYQESGIKSPIIVTYTRNGVVETTNVYPHVMFYSMGILGEFKEDGIKVLAIATVNDEMSSNIQIKKDDIITHVGGHSYLELAAIFNYITNYEGNNPNDELNKINMTVLRENQTHNIQVRPYSKRIMETQTMQDGSLIPIVKIQMGVNPTFEFNFIKSFQYSGQRTARSFTAIIDTFDLLFNESSVTIKALSGFVGIYSITSTIATQGVAPILNWMGLLSVNVGLLNLLPIPALDGGRLLFLGYEAVTRKKPNPKIETVLITVTMFLLLGLMIYVTFNDILKIINR